MSFLVFVFSNSHRRLCRPCTSLPSLRDRPGILANKRWWHYVTSLFFGGVQNWGNWVPLPSVLLVVLPCLQEKFSKTSLRFGNWTGNDFRGSTLRFWFSSPSAFLSDLYHSPVLWWRCWRVSYSRILPDIRFFPLLGLSLGWFYNSVELQILNNSEIFGVIYSCPNESK